MSAQRKVRGRGNTNSLPSSRNRSYCFTLNNYSDEDIKSIQNIDCKYCFQEETGAQGTKHLQGVLYFKNARSFAAVKKMIPRAHIEKTIDFNASVRYCSKEDSRTGKIYTNLGDLSVFGTNSTDKKVKIPWEEKLFKENRKLWEEMMVQRAVEETLLDEPYVDIDIYGRLITG